MTTALTLPLLSLPHLEKNDAFDQLWEMPSKWIEPPNKRRGGWSGAARVNLPGANGTEIPCILKKQQNHSYYAVRNGLLPRPTFEREAKNLHYLKSVGIHVPDLLFYGRRKCSGRDQAVLLIPELKGYRSLRSLLVQPEATNWSRRTIATAVGRMARQLHHEVGWVHRNLYPKHLFLKMVNDELDVCLIDLENARPLRRKHQVLDDLGPLLRSANRVGNPTLFDQVAFMQGYCQCGKLGPTERALMCKIATSK